jgi:hypothetical protein
MSFKKNYCLCRDVAVLLRGLKGADWEAAEEMNLETIGWSGF